MKAMVLEKPGQSLTLCDLPVPSPKQGQVRIKVIACGICRTDLHILDQELPPPPYPLVLGHQIVGKIDSPSSRFAKGELVGVPWLGKSCGECSYCEQEKENLCDDPTFTGYTVTGGFAQYCVADEDFIFQIPKEYEPIKAAPLLCGGMIGYRSLKMAENAQTIGFYGFGSAAHILLQIVTHQKREAFVFTRPGDLKGQEEARASGAVWAGGSDESPPSLLDAAILFAPVGELVPTALKAVKKGGHVICAGIHMSDIPSFPYEILWGERQLVSVANLTRKDGEELLALAPRVPIEPDVVTYPLEKAGEALLDLKEGNISGTAVLTL